MRRALGILLGRLAVGLLTGLSSGCHEEGAPRPARGDARLELILPQDLATLDPRYATRGLDVKVTRLSHAGLTRIHPDTLEPIPAAAESWRALDDRTLELRLRPGVRFQSGPPLRPEDVCATLAALADPRLQSPHRAVAKDVDGCEPLGAHAVRLHWSAPRASRLADLELPLLRADEARAAPRVDGRLDGLGPYVVTRRQGGTLWLDPAETGLDPRPRRGLRLRSVRDENARALLALSGRADVLPNALTPALIPPLTERGELSLVTRPGANLTYLLLHDERPPFETPRARRAVGQAIDRSAIVARLYGGYAQVADSLLPPQHWAALRHPPKLPFDPARAREVLAGARGVTLLVSTDRLRLVTARVIAQMLGDAGLPVEVVPLDLGALLARLDRGDFDLALLQFPELTEPHLLSWFFHAQGVPGEGGEGRNRARFRDAATSQLLELAGRTMDREARRRLYERALLQLDAWMPVVPLWHEDQLALVSARARGFSPSAEGRWLALAALP